MYVIVLCFMCGINAQLDKFSRLFCPALHTHKWWCCASQADTSYIQKRWPWTLGKFMKSDFKEKEHLDSNVGLWPRPQSADCVDNREAFLELST